MTQSLFNDFCRSLVGPSSLGGILLGVAGKTNPDYISQYFFFNSEFFSYKWMVVIQKAF